MLQKINEQDFVISLHCKDRQEIRNVPTATIEAVMSFFQYSYQKDPPKKKRIELFIPKGTLEYLCCPNEGDLVLILKDNRIVVTCYWRILKERGKYFFKGVEKVKNEVFILQP